MQEQIASAPAPDLVEEERSQGKRITAQSRGTLHHKQGPQNREDRVEVLQLLISGLANGCVYGLIALGFVLIYKATEAVNFAQGDFMMLGAFVTLGLVNPEYAGIPFWLALPLVFLIMGVLGYLLDLVVLRAVFGQSQVAVIIVTIALGFVIRFAVGEIWGHEPQSLRSPLALGDVRIGELVLGLADIAVIIVTLIMTFLLWQFFQRTKMGLAMQAASQNQMAAYYMGIPVKRIQGMVWALAGIVAAVAGILYASKGALDPTAGLHRDQGLCRGRDRRLRQPAGRAAGRADRRCDRAFRLALPAAGLEPDRALCPADRGPAVPPPRPVRAGPSEEGVRPMQIPFQDQITIRTSGCFPTGGTSASMRRCWLLALALPLLIDPFFLGEATNVLIWSVAGLGLMLLTGQTGQVSLGHAAFMALGCYSCVLMMEANVPFVLAFLLAGVITGVVGALIAIPALKLHGVYLAIATLALSILADDIIVLLKDWTDGVNGKMSPPIDLFGYEINRWNNPVEWLLSGAGRGAGGDAVLPQPAARAAGPGLCRRARQRDFGAGHGCQRGAAPRPSPSGLSCAITGLGRGADGPFRGGLQQRDVQLRDVDPAC